jgi:hypothetical protein
VAAEQEAEEVGVADERDAGVGGVLDLSPEFVDATDESCLGFLVSDPPAFPDLRRERGGRIRVGGGGVR